MAVILYDGVCGLCDRLVRWVARHDRKQYFRFAPLQGKRGGEIMADHNLSPDRQDTVLVLTEGTGNDEELLSRSAAVVFIAKSLGWPWKLALVARIFPLRWLDAGYDFISRHRYRIWGKLDSCPVPDARYRERFVDKSDGN
ncbi:MAG TPA: DCC1-like thiol-disulfide oxidoreductase family protein [candidate division Zixibacteria bacterium]|nr:DCC1-like thiol-disulfide oxidoreductase family protein [candidate division Zixibacteria bacterium]